MLPPRLVRRIVLAPLAIVVAVAVIVLSPLLALLTLVVSLAGRARRRTAHPPSLRGLRVLAFAIIWLAAEVSALFMCLGLWIASGFGGRLSTEPYQTRHYAVMRWFLDQIFAGAERSFGLRVEVDEPDEPCRRLAG